MVPYTIKIYLLDKLFILLVGIGMFIVTPFLFGVKTSIFLRAIIAIVWLYWCKALFLLPIDLLQGKKRRTCRFESCLRVDRYEFFRKKHSCIWRFCIGDRRLALDVPLSCSREDVPLKTPPSDRQITISYYPLSGLLLKWEEE